jgi:excisionase family DNA binding protein
MNHAKTQRRQEKTVGCGGASGGPDKRHWDFVSVNGVACLTRGQIAAALQVCPRTITAMMGRGEISYFKIGKLTRFPVDQVRKWVNQTGPLVGENSPSPNGFRLRPDASTFAKAAVDGSTGRAAAASPASRPSSAKGYGGRG